MNARLPIAMLGGFALTIAFPALAQTTSTPGPSSTLSGPIPNPPLGTTAPTMGTGAPTMGTGATSAGPSMGGMSGMGGMPH